MADVEIGIEQARKTLGDIADRARYAGQTTYLARHGRRIAAIVPLERIMTTYTVLIEASDEADEIWQALAPAEVVQDTGTAAEVAAFVAGNQNVAEGEGWRVRVWFGADPDTNAEPDGEYYPEAKTYTVAVATDPSCVEGDFCDVQILENEIVGYRDADDYPYESKPEYGMTDRLALETVVTDVRTDDDDKLEKAGDAADEILSRNGWKRTGGWTISDNAMYADAERQ